MYLDHYNLQFAPFENKPDPRFFFASEQHREALAAIEYTIRMRKGFVLVTGDIGSGKTTVGHTVQQRCRNMARMIQILHSHQDGQSVIAQLLRRLDMPCDGRESHGRMLEMLQRYLHGQLDRNQPLVLIVDEAQTLSDEALESLRLLSNFDTCFEKVIQIVLIGQPELRDRIRSSRHTALRQRIAMAKQLWPLSAADTSDYIRHRLGAAAREADAIGATFTDEALAEIYEVTGGIPRLINVVCDNCLLLGMVREIREIDAPMVHRVRQDMVPQFDDPTASNADVTGSLSLAG